MIDLGPTYQVTRLLRWTRDGDLTEVATNLGPGATIDPTGSTYYYAAVDGDRWSLAAYDVKTGARRMVVDMKPGTYVVGAQVSPDGKQLAASVWNGTAFVREGNPAGKQWWEQEGETVPLSELSALVLNPGGAKPAAH